MAPFASKKALYMNLKLVRVRKALHVPLEASMIAKIEKTKTAMMYWIQLCQLPVS